jgi:hypothetical protein
LVLPELPDVWYYTAFCYSQQGGFMERLPHALTRSDSEFKELFGVKKETFHHMLAVLSAAYEIKRHSGGPRLKLSISDKLLLTLQYWREYRAMRHIGYDFGVAKSTVSDTVTWVEDTLIQDGTFHLPGKKALLSGTKSRTFVVDVTESPIERPKKNKKNGIPARRSNTLSRRKSLQM